MACRTCRAQTGRHRVRPRRAAPRLVAAALLRAARRRAGRHAQRAGPSAAARPAACPTCCAPAAWSRTTTCWSVDAPATGASSWSTWPTPLPDPRLIDLGAETCLRHGLVPWRRVGRRDRRRRLAPEAFRRLRPMLEAALGPVCAGLAPPRAIVAAIHALRGDRAGPRRRNTACPPPKAAATGPRLHRVAAAPWPGLIAAGARCRFAPVATGLALLAFPLVSLALPSSR